MKRWLVIITLGVLIGVMAAEAAGPRPPVEISQVNVTWGGFPVGYIGFEKYDLDTPWLAYGEYVQYGAGTLLPGSAFGWGNTFSGSGPTLFMYGSPEEPQLIFLDGPEWTAEFTGDPQGVNIQFGSKQDGYVVINKTDPFPVSIDLKDIAGGKFSFSGTVGTFDYDAASDTAEMYLIEGAVEYGGETYTGPDDGATALHLTAAGGTVTSESTPLADAQAAIPAVLRSLTVDIELVEPFAQPGISAAFDLDGNPATGLGVDGGAIYTGLGADLIMSAQPDASGKLNGQAQIVGADGDLSDPFPVAVMQSASQQMIQLQADLDMIRQQAARMNVGIGVSGMRWRVAAFDPTQPDLPPDFVPIIPVGPMPRANFSVSYTTTSGSLTVTFADKSTPIDPANPITGWLWDFGDNTSSTEMNPAHTYAGGGEYQVTLTLTFADNNTDAMTVVVQLEGPPPPEPPPADVCLATTTTAANLRDGPDTIYAVVGSLSANEALYVTGINAAGNWYMIQTERFPSAWIASFLITPPECPAGFSLPVRG